MAKKNDKLSPFARGIAGLFGERKDGELTSESRQQGQDAEAALRGLREEYQQLIVEEGRQTRKTIMVGGLVVVVVLVVIGGVCYWCNERTGEKTPA